MSKRPPLIELMKAMLWTFLLILSSMLFLATSFFVYSGLLILALILTICWKKSMAYSEKTSLRNLYGTDKK
jgi:hypothetical protein